MPLTILLPMVVIGIAGIALLLHLLGYSRQVEIASAGDAARLWLENWPEDEVQDATVAADRHAALVHTGRGTGLLWSFGADTAGRLLHGAEAKQNGHGVVVHLHDFTAPSVTLHLRPEEVPAWIAEIEGRQA